MVRASMSFFRLSGSYTELSSLTALDKPPAEEEKAEADDNAQTIRPGRSPQGLGTTVPLPVAKAPEPQIAPIAEDYSDLLFEEDEAKLEEKVADFKVRLRPVDFCTRTNTHFILYYSTDEEFGQAWPLPSERHQDVRYSAPLSWPNDRTTAGSLTQTLATFAQHHLWRACERTVICPCTFEVILVRRQ